MTDVALDPYTSHGHDGILKKNEIIMIKQSKYYLNKLFFKLRWDVMSLLHPT